MRDRDTLGLDGDLDDVDMILALEEAFDVEFGREVDWVTVGDVFDALLEQIPPSDQPGKCATSMAFYRLRRALRIALNSEAPIGPRTLLRDLTALSAKAAHKELAPALGLRLPAASPGRVGQAGLLLLVSGFLGGVAAVVVHGLWPCAALAPVGLIMMWLDPRTFGSQTVGDLAREVATRNFRSLAQAGADRRPETIWAALIELLGAVVETAPANITRDTRLLA